MKTLFEECEAAYYGGSAMIKFLLVENLAMKSLLHKKGVITPEEFKECRDIAARVLDEKATKQIRELMAGGTPPPTPAAS